MKYGKMVDGKLEVYPHDYLETDAGIVTNPPLDMWLGRGLKPIYEATRTPTHTPREGFHLERDGWTEQAKAFVPRYRLVKDAPPPPKVYDKYYLLAALKEAGALAAFLQLIGADAETEALWNAAETLPADDELFKQVLGTAKEQLHLTDEQIAAILAKAER